MTMNKAMVTLLTSVFTFLHSFLLSFLHFLKPAHMMDMMLFEILERQDGQEKTCGNCNTDTECLK